MTDRSEKAGAGKELPCPDPSCPAPPILALSSCRCVAATASTWATWAPPRHSYWQSLWPQGEGKGLIAVIARPEQLGCLEGSVTGHLGVLNCGPKFQLQDREAGLCLSECEVDQQAA